MLAHRKFRCICDKFNSHILCSSDPLGQKKWSKIHGLDINSKVYTYTFSSQQLEAFSYAHLHAFAYIPSLHYVCTDTLNIIILTHDLTNPRPSCIHGHHYAGEFMYDVGYIRKCLVSAHAMDESFISEI